MNFHVLKHAQPDAFACEVCGKTFKRQTYVGCNVPNLHHSHVKCSAACKVVKLVVDQHISHGHNKPKTNIMIISTQCLMIMIHCLVY